MFSNILFVLEDPKCKISYGPIPKVLTDRYFGVILNFAGLEFCRLYLWFMLRFDVLLGRDDRVIGL